MTDLIKLGCECGDVLKFSSLYPERAAAYKAIWDQEHRGHEEINVQEAYLIRRSEHARRNRLKHRAAFNKRVGNNL